MNKFMWKFRFLMGWGNFQDLEDLSELKRENLKTGFWESLGW